MSRHVRIIRFARATGSVPSETGAAVVARVLLDEPAEPVGEIIRTADEWSYRVADGSPSGLSSVVSRLDLERQILLFHLGPLSGTAAEPPDYFGVAI